MLLLAVLLSAMTVSVVRIGLSLSMKAIHFSPAAIAGANVVGGLVTIPVVLGFGALSDRLGRRLFLALGYLLAAFSGVSLVLAEQLWHFWIVASAVLIARSISGSLASAMATDILPPQTLGRSLPVWHDGLGFGCVGFCRFRIRNRNFRGRQSVLDRYTVVLGRRGIDWYAARAASRSASQAKLGQPLERLTQPSKGEIMVTYPLLKATVPRSAIGFDYK